MKALDREHKASYDLVAEARDQGSPVKSTRINVRVNVKDVNDNEPIIVDPQEDVVSVREQQPIGTEVVRVRAIDKDNGSNATITYSILRNRDSDGDGAFSIDANTGMIKTNVGLDHEDRNMYRIKIAASDNGTPSKQTIRLLRIEVLDLNDNRPTFTSSSLQFKVKESVPVGFVVGILRGGDTSQNNHVTGNSFDITYAMASITADVHEGCFDIDRKTGALVVARPLDRESQQDYKLEIRALDMRSSNNPQSATINVDIEVEDVNDNAPKWAEDPIVIELLEDAKTGTIVYNFTAVDSDLGLNGIVQYSVVGQSPVHPGLFEVDSLTGSFRLIGPLDYENVTDYVLVVQAQDQSGNLSERLSTAVTVHVTVIDVNDNEPVFVAPAKDNSYVSLNSIPSDGEVILKVIAFDRDHGDNGRIVYKIEDGNNDGRFAMNEESGEVVLAKPFVTSAQMSRYSKYFYADEPPTDRKSAGPQWNFQLVVLASDFGEPIPKEARRTIKVMIESTKPKPPRFVESTYYANISENIQTGSFVIRVEAKSFDHNNGKLIRFEGPCKYYVRVLIYSCIISCLSSQVLA